MSDKEFYLPESDEDEGAGVGYKTVRREEGGSAEAAEADGGTLVDSGAQDGVAGNDDERVIVAACIQGEEEVAVEPLVASRDLDDHEAERGLLGRDVVGGSGDEDLREIAARERPAPDLSLCPNEFSVMWQAASAKHKKDVVFAMDADATDLLGSRDEIYYYIQRFGEGFFIEAHLGGAKLPLVPDLVKIFEANQNQPVYVRTAYERYWLIEFDRDASRFTVLQLREGDVPPANAVYAQPSRKKMKPFEPHGTGLVIAGAVTATIGTLLLGVSMFFSSMDEALWMHPRMETMPMSELPIKQWGKLVGEPGERSVAKALVYGKDDGWSVTRDRLEGESVEDKIRKIGREERVEADGFDAFEESGIGPADEERLRQLALDRGVPLEVVVKEYLERTRR